MRSIQFAWLMLIPVLGAAEIYRWVDENGVVNYTQHSPEGVSTELTVTRGTLSVVTPVAAPPKVEDPDAQLSDEQKAMKQKLEEVEGARQAEIARIKQSNCGRAQEVLDKLTSRGRIRIRDSDGNETAMGDDERESRIAEAQQDIVSNCTAAG